MHVPIEYDEGVRYIARVRRPGYYALPSLIERPFIQGEMDTLRWFERCGLGLTPKVKSPIFSECAA
jgi:hypothetical protein